MWSDETVGSGRSEQTLSDGASVGFARRDVGERRCLLEVSGDLDIAISTLFSLELDTLLDLGTREVDVDLSGVKFMDSSALRALVHAHERAKESGQRFCLVSPSPACTKV